jgi:glycosyltransferase involved in cell wall biosynthesis
VQQLWDVPTRTLYPPVRPSVSPGDKRPLILALGRFFDPSHGHCKKQRELLDTFARLHRSGRLDGWELALVGGADAANREYVLDVRRAAQDLPVAVHVNAPGTLVEELLGAASVFWHGAGYGEDPARHPERFEHFGISVVEAMAAGGVPVVFGAAGPAEIVRDGRDGVHWHTLDELAERTCDLAADPARRATLAVSAVERAADFSAGVFAEQLLGIVGALPR